MTHLLIHTDITTRRTYLLKEINRYLKRDFQEISQLRSVPDIHIVELTQKASIGIDEIKLLQKEMIFKPFEELYQVGIILHAGTMTHEAQNALLKTLEEASDHTLYFLLADNEQHLLPTIVSRSIKHYVKQADTEETDEETTVTKPEILTMSLPDQFKEIENTINQDKEDGRAVKEFINDLIKYYRQELHVCVQEGRGENKILAALSNIEDAHRKINANVNKRLSLENLILKLTPPI